MPFSAVLAGAIYAQGNSTVTVANGTFKSNTAQDGYQSNADGGAICIFDNAVLTLNDTLLENNTAPSGRGGGVAVTSKG